MIEKIMGDVQGRREGKNQAAPEKAGADGENRLSLSFVSRLAFMNLVFSRPRNFAAKQFLNVHVLKWIEWEHVLFPNHLVTRPVQCLLCRRFEVAKRLLRITSVDPYSEE